MKTSRNRGYNSASNSYEAGGRYLEGKSKNLL